MKIPYGRVGGSLFVLALALGCGVLTAGQKEVEHGKEAGLLKFMVTGLGPKGNTADAPMPAYKLTQKDAEAVIEYLKSLK